MADPAAYAARCRIRVLDGHGVSAWTYAWLFRSIPLIVLLLVLNNLGYLYDAVALGVPFTDITFISYPTTGSSCLSRSRYWA